jgi:alpha-beta hydrolase superfamily lysophospholipase
MNRVAVEVVAGDGAVLRGEMIERSADWAVLVHDLGEDIDGWRPIVSRLSGEGMSTLALDLRGHGGSDGDADPARTANDMRVACAFARERGARRVYLCAAGRSTAAAVETGRAAACAALVLIAPVEPGLDGAVIPRLAVVSSFDPAQQAAAATLRRGPGWALVANVPVEGGGLGLLATEWSSNVVEYVRVFVKGQRLARVPAASQ